MEQKMIMPLEELLQLKNGELKPILEVLISMKGATVLLNEDLAYIWGEHIESFMELIPESLQILDKNNKFMTITAEEEPYCRILLDMKDDAEILCNFTKITEDELLEEPVFKAKLDQVLTRILRLFQEAIDEYADKKDRGELFEPSRYQFIFEKTGGDIKYQSFVRMTENPIQEQKEKIAYMLQKGIDKQLLSLINTENIPGNFIVQFISDGHYVMDIKTAVL